MEDLHTYFVGVLGVLVHNSTYDKVTDLYDRSRPGKKTKGKTEQRIFDGDFENTMADFESLNPTNVREIKTNWGQGKVGVSDDGYVATARPGSSYGKPTLEIRNPNNGRGLEFRYE